MIITAKTHLYRCPTFYRDCGGVLTWDPESVTCAHCKPAARVLQSAESAGIVLAGGVFVIALIVISTP